MITVIKHSLLSQSLWHDAGQVHKWTKYQSNWIIIKFMYDIKYLNLLWKGSAVLCYNERHHTSSLGALQQPHLQQSPRATPAHEGRTECPCCVCVRAGTCVWSAVSLNWETVQSQCTLRKCFPSTRGQFITNSESQRLLSTVSASVLRGGRPLGTHRALTGWWRREDVTPPPHT